MYFLPFNKSFSPFSISVTSKDGISLFLKVGLLRYAKIRKSTFWFHDVYRNLKIVFLCHGNLSEHRAIQEKVCTLQNVLLTKLLHQFERLQLHWLTEGLTFILRMYAFIMIIIRVSPFQIWKQLAIIDCCHSCSFIKSYFSRQFSSNSQTRIEFTYFA